MNQLKSIKSNGEIESIDEKDQCWVGADKFQITSYSQRHIPSGIQTRKNSDFGLLKITSDYYEREGEYLQMKFYFTTDGTDRYERYFKSLEDYFRLEVYRHKHEEERHQRIDKAHINQIKRKWPKTSMVVLEPESVKGSVSTAACHSLGSRTLDVFCYKSVDGPFNLRGYES